jgi:hypothetical protein
MKVQAPWTVFDIVYILCLRLDKGEGALDCVLYCICSLPGRDEGAGALDCVLYCIYSLPDSR